MALDLTAMHRLIVNELTASHSLRESMDHVINACSKERTHDDWKILRGLPYEDLEDLREWIEKPFRLDPPSEKLAGLWFGLFNPIYDRKAVADIYICGSKRFVASPDDNSWAVGPDWWPEHRYAESKSLADIYEIAYRKNGLGNDAEYPLCLGFSAFAVRDLLNTMDATLVIDTVESVGVAVGFDSGDSVLLGRLTKKGLAPLGPDTTTDKTRIEILVERLRSADNKGIFTAIIALTRFGVRACEAVPELVRIAGTNKLFGVRQIALSTLASVGPNDRSAKAAILLALKDKNPFVRREALQALISVNDLSAEDLAQIKQMEHDSDENVANWSEITLRNIRSRNKV